MKGIFEGDSFWELMFPIHSSFRLRRRPPPMPHGAGASPVRSPENGIQIGGENCAQISGAKSLMVSNPSKTGEGSDASKYVDSPLKGAFRQL
jgi:hypothetical protein